MIARVVAKLQIPAKAAGMFYKAIVQAVLLYGSETWVVDPPMLNVLESFHNRVARKITGRMAYLDRDTWIYPPIKETLEKANLYPVAHYIHVRQAHLADFVATRPILATCRQTQQAIGESERIRWWTQPLLSSPTWPHPTTEHPNADPAHQPPMGGEVADEAVDMDIDELWEADDLPPLPPVPAMARAGGRGLGLAVLVVDEVADDAADRVPPPPPSPPARPATLRSFTRQEENLIAEALYSTGDESEVLYQLGTDSIQRQSIQTLRPGLWLNDEVIHFALHTMAQRDEDLCTAHPTRRRCHFFKSYFMSALMQQGHVKRAKSATGTSVAGAPASTVETSFSWINSSSPLTSPEPTGPS